MDSGTLAEVTEPANGQHSVYKKRVLSALEVGMLKILNNSKIPARCTDVSYELFVNLFLHVICSFEKVVDSNSPYLRTPSKETCFMGTSLKRDFDMPSLSLLFQVLWDTQR